MFRGIAATSKANAYLYLDSQGSIKPLLFVGPSLLGRRRAFLCGSEIQGSYCTRFRDLGLILVSKVTLISLIRLMDALRTLIFLFLVVMTKL